MATYAIQAPNGQTYQIDGPAGATDEQVRAEVLKQHPDAGSTKPQGRSLLGAVGEGISNLIPHSAQATMAMLNLPDQARQAAQELVSNPDARHRLASAIKGQTSHMGDVVGGYVQQLRDLSPPESQGSAPRMATAPAQQMEAGVVQKYGVNPDPRRLAAAMQGDVGQPNTNAYETFKTDIAEHPLSTLATVAPFVPKVPGMGGVADAAAGAVRGAGAVLDAGATPAAEAVRSAALAKVLAQQKTAAQVASQAETLKAADVPLRSAMEDAAKAQAAKGVGVSDIPEAKALVKALEAKLNPTGEVGTVLLPDQAKPYQQIIDTLSPKNGPRPDLESIDNLRRAIVKPAYTGGQTGYDAIPKADRKALGKALSSIEDAYTGNLHGPVQENYTAYKAAQDQADEMAKLAPDLQLAASKLDTLSPQQSAKTARSIVDKLAKQGLISDADHREFQGLAQAAIDAKGKAAFRKKLALIGAGVAGIGATGGHALHLLP